MLLAKLLRNLGTLAGFFVAHGKDLSLYVRTKKKAGKYEGDMCCAALGSKVKAQQECRDPKNADKLARNGKVKTSVSMSLS
jgi:hypothetical protein